MKKQQKQVELIEMINASGIYEALRSIEKTLGDYRETKKAKRVCYAVQLEWNKISREFEKFEDLLSDLPHRLLELEQLE